MRLQGCRECCPPLPFDFAPFGGNQIAAVRPFEGQVADGGLVAGVVHQHNLDLIAKLAAHFAGEAAVGSWRDRLNFAAGVVDQQHGVTRLPFASKAHLLPPRCVNVQPVTLPSGALLLARVYGDRQGATVYFGIN